MYESCFFLFDLSTGECASWVQAWGSILAIFAAAGFTWWQHRLDLKRARDAENEANKRRVEVLIHVAEEVHEMLRRTMTRYVDATSRLSRHESESLCSRLERLELLISSIPRTELPHAKLALLTIRLERTVVWSKTHIKALGLGMNGDHLNFDKLGSCETSMARILSALRQAQKSPSFNPDAEYEDTPDSESAMSR
jgi:hypothetical protein